MEPFQFILLLFAVVLASAVVNKVFSGIAAPLIQILFGGLIAVFSSTAINATVDPELFLVLFIAPLLYEEAREVDKVALWNNRMLVVSLAVGLVLVTLLAVGFSVNALEPSIPLAAAFALGAALGPTDAVAVASLSTRASLTKSQQILLSGESLINDASGVVSFQFAIAAVVTGSFSLMDASISFIISFFGGILMGLLLILVIMWVVDRIRAVGLESTTFHVLFEIMTPFLIFLIAESVHVSGILAVVAAGLLQPFLERELSPEFARMKIVSSSVWQVFTFALNGIVFVLLGMQLPQAMNRTWQDSAISNTEVIGIVLLITVISIAVRTLWFMGISFVRRRRLAKEEQETSGGTPEQKAAVIRGVRPVTKESFVEACALSIAGPKGAVTLSIVFTLPFSLPTGELFPQRDLIIFLASGVILLTLLLANFVLPLLLPKARPQTICDTDARLDVLRAVIEELTGRQTPANRTAMQQVLKQYDARVARIKHEADLDSSPDAELRLEALHWQQDYVMDQIDRELVSPMAGYAYLRRLSRTESLLLHRSPLRGFLASIFRRADLIWRYVRRIVATHTPIAIAEDAEELHVLQVRSIEHAVARLEELLLEEDSSTEDVNALIIELRGALRRLRVDTLSVSSATRLELMVAEIKREGLRLELEHIQQMFETGRINRATAKHMRENVYLMQIDLEDRI